MKVTPINKCPNTEKIITVFLKKRGIVLSGGSIVEEDGCETVHVGIEHNSFGSYSENLAADLKKVLGVEKLVFNGQVVN